jgi:hypothetical protein
LSAQAAIDVQSLMNLLRVCLGRATVMSRLGSRHLDGSFGFQLKRSACCGGQQSDWGCYQDSQYGSRKYHSNVLNIQRLPIAGQVTNSRGKGAKLAKSPKRLNSAITKSPFDHRNWEDWPCPVVRHLRRLAIGARSTAPVPQRSVAG